MVRTAQAPDETLRADLLPRLNRINSSASSVTAGEDDTWCMWFVEVLFSLCLIGSFAYIVYDTCTDKRLVGVVTSYMTWVESSNFLILVPSLVGFSALWTLVQGLNTILCLAVGYVLHTLLPRWLAVLIGVGIVYIGTFIGASASYVLGRTLLRPFVVRACRRQEYLQGLDLAFLHHGARISFIIRLLPLVPSGPLNYAFGASSLSYIAFFFGYLGGLPYYIVCVYLGTLASSLSSIGTTVQDQLDSLDLEVWQVSLIISAIVIVVVALIWALSKCANDEIKNLVKSAEVIHQSRQGSVHGSPQGSQRTVDV